MSLWIPKTFVNVWWMWQSPYNLSSQKWKQTAPEASKLTSPTRQIGKLSSSEKPSLNILGWSRQTPSTFGLHMCSCAHLHAWTDTATPYITHTYHTREEYIYSWAMISCLWICKATQLMLLFWIILGLHNHIQKTKDQKGVGRNKFDICQLYHLFVLLFLQTYIFLSLHLECNNQWVISGLSTQNQISTQRFRMNRNELIRIKEGAKKLESVHNRKHCANNHSHSNLSPQMNILDIFNASCFI